MGLDWVDNSEPEDEAVTKQREEDKSEFNQLD